jgi:hypothetical protein
MICPENYGCKCRKMSVRIHEVIEKYPCKEKNGTLIKSVGR